MKRAFLFLLIIFGINTVGLYYGWYWKWNWFDSVMHLSGGLFMAMFMASYLKDRLTLMGWTKNILIIAGTTVFIGVIWEFAEFIANQTLIDFVYDKFRVRTYFMGDLNDTVLDLLMDILGALVFVLFAYKQIFKHSK